jgi:hypothetical protein
VVKIQRLVLVASAIWLLGTTVILFSAAEGKWSDFLFLYTFVALIPVILVNGICWIIKA